jgi:hypothetical protein
MYTNSLTRPSGTPQAIQAVVDAPAALNQLRLTPAEMAALQKQGFVAAEMRGRRTIIYKLRFRVDGRQHVRYLGNDVAFVAAVQCALQIHQRGHELRSELRALTRDAAQLLRGTKRQLTPHLKQAGFVFHGRAVRQKRRKVTPLAREESRN